MDTLYFVLDRQYNEDQTAVLPTRQCEQQGGECIRKECCKDNYFVSGLCDDESLTCCLSKEDCSWQEEEGK